MVPAILLLHRDQIFTANGVRAPHPSYILFTTARESAGHLARCIFPREAKKREKVTSGGYLWWRARGETISRKCTRNVVYGATRRLLSLMHRFALMATRDPLGDHSRFLRGEERKWRVCAPKWHVNGARVCGNGWPEYITHDDDTCSPLNVHAVNCLSIRGRLYSANFAIVK